MATRVRSVDDVEAALNEVASVTAFAEDVVLRGIVVTAQGAPTEMTTTATMTDAGMLGGIITGTHTAGATQTYTTRTGTQIEAALAAVVGALTTNDSFKLTIINLSAALADTVTIAGGTGVSIVGKVTVDSAHADSEFPSSGTFLFRRSAANTFIAYRIN